MDLTEKIKYHHTNKKYCEIRRQVGINTSEKSMGYVVDYSDNFVLLQEINYFDICGFLAIPMKTITDLQFNNRDKHYDKIMKLEGLKDKIENKHKIDLTSWTSIFKSIKSLGFNVIIENEDPENISFDIGAIEKITKASVYIRYFDARGLLNSDLTKITWDLITKVGFDNRYINIHSKYLRMRKIKK